MDQFYLRLQTALPQLHSTMCIVLLVFILIVHLTQMKILRNTLWFYLNSNPTFCVLKIRWSQISKYARGNNPEAKIRALQLWPHSESHLRWNQTGHTYGVFNSGQIFFLCWQDSNLMQVSLHITVILMACLFLDSCFMPL